MKHAFGDGVSVCVVCELMGKVKHIVVYGAAVENVATVSETVRLRPIYRERAAHKGRGHSIQ